MWIVNRRTCSHYAKIQMSFLLHTNVVPNLGLVLEHHRFIQYIPLISLDYKLLEYDVLVTDVTLEHTKPHHPYLLKQYEHLVFSFNLKISKIVLISLKWISWCLLKYFYKYYIFVLIEMLVWLFQEIFSGLPSWNAWVSLEQHWGFLLGYNQNTLRVSSVSAVQCCMRNKLAQLSTSVIWGRQFLLQEFHRLSLPPETPKTHLVEMSSLG